MPLSLRASAPSNAKDILQYFLRNPRAADSLEGVARWRVRSEAIHQTVEQVSRALRWLVSEGFLLEELGRGREPVFRLNGDMLTEAQRFVDEGSGSGGGATVPVPPGSEVVAQRVVQWIDATLHRYVTDHPPGERDMPGLALSHSSLLSLLAPHREGAQPAGERGVGPIERAWSALESALDSVGVKEPLGALYVSLRLTRLELKALLLCLASEIDVKYQRVYGVLNDDLGRRGVTLGLLCALLGKAVEVRRSLDASGGLTAWRLLESGATLPHADDPLRLDPAIVTWLMGGEEALLADPLLAGAVRRTRAREGNPWIHEAGDQQLLEQVGGLLSADRDCEGWIVLSGSGSDGWWDLVEAAAPEGDGLVLVGAVDLAGIGGAELRELAIRVGRAWRLMEATLVIDVGGGRPPTMDPGLLSDLIERISGPGRRRVMIAPDATAAIRLLGGEQVMLLRRQSTPPPALADVFSVAATEAGLSLTEAEAGRLAVSYSLEPTQIRQATRLAALEAGSREGPVGSFSVLSAACRRLASPELPRFARRVEPAFTLADVVLPADRHGQLREIIAHIRHAPHVLNAWGFGAQLPYGRGVAALFCGPSGTGKTMAAQAIASSLETETYIVDLSRVVSKYIGETEKNLDAVFTDAERGGAVLLFDEADALFGKRSEVKDAHDRYANIEISYLLQRMEEFRGLAILATNLRRNLDEAFARRLRFVVDFPRPGPEAREAIWHQCLPARAPRSSQVDAGVAFLARRLDLTGGNIRQITLRAAFTAADGEAREITMRHLLDATRAELRRLGMVSMEKDLATYDVVGAEASPQVA